MERLVIRRASYGTLVLDDADSVAVEFFASERSSVVEYHGSYVDRAAAGADLGRFAFRE